MQNKTIIITVILVIILGLAGYFFYKRAAPTPELQLPQSPTPAAETQPLSEPTIQPEPTNSVTTEKAPPQIQPEEQNIIVYTGLGFSPSTLKVKIGTTVIFKNESSRAIWPASDLHPTHRLYGGTSLAEHCPDPAVTAFDACTAIQPGNSWSFAFNKKGTWPYHDHLNPAYVGTIIVE